MDPVSIGFLKEAGVLGAVGGFVGRHPVVSAAMGAGLAGGAVGAMAHKSLTSGPALKQDDWKKQVRAKSLDRYGQH